MAKRKEKKSKSGERTKLFITCITQVAKDMAGYETLTTKI